MANPTFIAATTGSSAPRKLMEAGSYAARCYSMVELGTIEEDYQGEKKIQRKIRLAWEFPTETHVFNSDKGKEPMVLGKEYTFSMHEKASLRKDLGAWRGRTFTDEDAAAFDIGRLLGVECLINVSQHVTLAGKTVNKIMGLGRMPKGMTCPPQVNPAQAFSLAEFDHTLFAALPGFVRDRIKTSREYVALVNPPAADDSPQEPVFADQYDDGEQVPF